MPPTRAVRHRFGLYCRDTLGAQLKIRRLIGGSMAALAFVALTPVPAQAATATIYQTDPTTCRVNLAKPGAVLIIGDSITAGWFTASTAQYTAAGRPACINGQAGRATAGAVIVLASYKSAGMITPSTTVVMAIGSNNTQGYPSEPTSLRQGGSRQGRLARGRSKLGGWPRFPGGADRTVFGLERAMSCW